MHAKRSKERSKQLRETEGEGGLCSGACNVFLRGSPNKSQQENHHERKEGVG